jgi:dihydropteroate synthase
MGILNVTPDSFSDGGSWTDTAAAIEYGLQMSAQGADILDVGGESTRPGADRLPAYIQIERVLPVIHGINDRLSGKVNLSIDTTLATVAEAAINAGVSIINDVSAGRDDPDLLRLAADRKLPLILMHMQGTPATMQQNPVYDDVVEEVRAFLIERADAAIRAGVGEEQIIIDPGIGFGKTLEHNIQLLNNLHRLTDTGYPIMLGASRKRFLGAICAGTTAVDLAGATCATTALGVLAGVSIFRVHDVGPNRQTADVTWRIMQGRHHHEHIHHEH